MGPRDSVLHQNWKRLKCSVIHIFDASNEYLNSCSLLIRTTLHYTAKLTRVYDIFCLSALYSNKISFTYMQLEFVMVFKPPTAHELNRNSRLVLIRVPCWNTILTKFCKKSLSTDRSTPYPSSSNYKLFFYSYLFGVTVLCPFDTPLLQQNSPFVKQLFFNSMDVSFFHSAGLQINESNGIRLNSMF